MKVYIAVRGWDYEGFEILGVFDSANGAQLEIQQVKKQNRGGDYFDIYTYELNKGSFK